MAEITRHKTQAKMETIEQQPQDAGPYVIGQQVSGGNSYMSHSQNEGPQYQAETAEYNGPAQQNAVSNGAPQSQHPQQVHLPPVASPSPHSTQFASNPGFPSMNPQYQQLPPPQQPFQFPPGNYPMPPANSFGYYPQYQTSQQWMPAGNKPEIEHSDAKQLALQQSQQSQQSDQRPPPAQTISHQQLQSQGHPQFQGQSIDPMYDPDGYYANSNQPPYSSDGAYPPSSYSYPTAVQFNYSSLSAGNPVVDLPVMPPQNRTLSYPMVSMDTRHQSLPSPQSAISPIETHTVSKPKRHRRRNTDPNSSPAAGMSPETAARNRCPKCQKQFKRPSSLQTHLYSHTGEKPFQCSWDGCGRSFSVRSNMTRHMKLHERDYHSQNSDKLNDNNGLQTMNFQALNQLSQSLNNNDNSYRFVTGNVANSVSYTNNFSPTAPLNHMVVAANVSGGNTIGPKFEQD